MQKYTYIYWVNTDTMINDASWKTHDKDAEDFNYIYLSFYCKGSKGLFKGLHVRGCWRPNINFIF